MHYLLRFISDTIYHDKHLGQEIILSQILCFDTIIKKQGSGSFHS